MEKLKTWNLDNIYTGFDDKAYLCDISDLKNICSEISETISAESSPCLDALEKAVQLLGRAMDIYETLYSYAFAVFSVNTDDERAAKEVSQLEDIHPLLSQCLVLFRTAVKSIKKEIPSLLKKSPILAERSLFIKEALIEAEHQLSDKEEKLAEELKASGGESWGHLQEAVASALEAAGESVNHLRNLAYSPKRTERKKPVRHKTFRGSGGGRVRLSRHYGGSWSCGGVQPEHYQGNAASAAAAGAKQTVCCG